MLDTNKEIIMSIGSLEKNKKSIRVYCAVLQIAGWALLASGVLSSVRHVIGIASTPAPTSHDLARYLLLQCDGFVHDAIVKDSAKTLFISELYLVNLVQDYNKRAAFQERM